MAILEGSCDASGSTITSRHAKLAAYYKVQARRAVVLVLFPSKFCRTLLALTGPHIAY